MSYKLNFKWSLFELVRKDELKTQQHRPENSDNLIFQVTIVIIVRLVIFKRVEHSLVDQ